MEFRIWSAKVDNDNSLSIKNLYPRLVEDKDFINIDKKCFVNIDNVSDLLRIGKETKKSLVIDSNNKDIRIDDDYF